MQFSLDKETKQEILSQYSGCFKGIGHFPGEPYRFHLKPEHKPTEHAPRKVPVHLEDSFKQDQKFPRDGELPQQIQCIMCTPQCTPLCTHPSGQRLQTNAGTVYSSAETTLRTGASKKGLRACLIQKAKVINFASHALT